MAELLEDYWPEVRDCEIESAYDAREHAICSRSSFIIDHINNLSQNGL